MNRLNSIAKQTIPVANGNHQLLYANGDNSDIIKSILYADSKSKHYTRKFAPHLRGHNLLQTCSNIWTFLNENINYVEDPEGVQSAKSPAQTLKDGYADCKSLSIFTGSILKNLGISYSYRFAGYKEQGIYNHVYVIINDGSKEIIIDSVIDEFNTEKDYLTKKDYNMARTFYVSGTGDSIGSFVDVVNSALKKLPRNRKPFTLVIKGLMLLFPKISILFLYIFFNTQKLLNVLPPIIRKKRVKSTKVINFISKAFGINPGELMKVVRAALVKKFGARPEKLLIYNMAPSFILLFVNKDSDIRRLNTKLRSQRKKSEIIAQEMQRAFKFTGPQFMAIVRDGIMLRLKSIPEQILFKQGLIESPTTKKKIKLGKKGVGAVPPQVIIAIIGIIPLVVKVVGQIISAIVKVIGSKGEEPPADIKPGDVPDPGKDLGIWNIILGLFKGKKDDLTFPPDPPGGDPPPEGDGKLEAGLNLSTLTGVILPGVIVAGVFFWALSKSKKSKKAS